MIQEVAYQFRFLPTRIKILIFTAAFIILFVYIHAIMYFTKIEFPMTILEERTCPACYGTSLCSEFTNRPPKMTEWSTYRILDFTNIKNVHTARYRGHDIVLKKLAHSKEIDKVDQDICGEAKLGEFCDRSKAMTALATRGYSEEGPLVSLAQVTGMNDLTKCPSSRLVDLINGLFDKSPGPDSRVTRRANLLYTLRVNPEPIILQLFPKEKGFPFPRVVGTCGRFVAVERAPKLLEDYSTAPWRTRVSLALKMIRIAEQLTDNDTEFALYWTDLAWTNVGVTESEDVWIIDAENIIVVDKRKITAEKPAHWDFPLVVEHYSCPADDRHCLAFSVADLCSRRYADFNYYAVCKNILSPTAPYGGLLHSIPAELQVKHKLPVLLAECVKPQGDDRTEPKDDIVRALEAILRES